MGIKNRVRNGFTLIELLIAIAVIAIIAYDIARLNGRAPGSPAVVNLRGKNEAALAASSTTWLNMECYWSDSDGVDHYFRTVHTSCERDFHGNTLHSGAGNYSYLDGHVKWLTPEEAGEIDCANGPLPAPFKN